MYTQCKCASMCVCNHGYLSPCAQVMQTSIQADSQGDSEGGGDGADQSMSVSAPVFDLPRLFIRLFDYEPVTQLKNIKAPLYGSSYQ